MAISQLTVDEYKDYERYLKRKFSDYADSDIIHQALDKLVKGELTGDVAHVRRCLTNKMIDLIRHEKFEVPLSPTKHYRERDWQEGYAEANRAYRDKAAKNQAELAEVVARLIDNPSLFCNAGIVKRLPRADDLESLEHKPVIMRALAGAWADFKTFKSLVEDAHEMQRAINQEARSKAVLALRCAVRQANNLVTQEEGQ